MSKKLALVDDAEPIPQFLRTVTPTGPVTVETEAPASEVVAPLTEEPPAEEPKPEPIDLAAVEAELKALCAEPLPTASIALEIQNEAAARARRLQSDRQAVADRMQMIVNRTDDVVAVYTEKLADYDKGIDKILNGIGHTDAA